jgi:hypothetical protein
MLRRLTYSCLRLLASLGIASCVTLLSACGGSEGGGTPSSGPGPVGVTLSAPEPLFVAATSPSTVSLAWTPAAASAPNARVAYQVHSASTADFQPNSASVRATVAGGTETTVDGLSPASTLYFKVVAVADGATPVSSTKSLRATMPATALRLKQGVVVRRDSDLGLANPSITATTLQYRLTTQSAVAPTGTYLTGYDSVTNKAFLRRITATRTQDGVLTLETTDAALESVIQSGDIMFSFRGGDSATTAANLDRGISAARPKALSALKGSGNCSTDSVADSTIKVEFSESFEPDADVSIKFEAGKLKTVDAVASVDLAVSARAALVLSGSVSRVCTLPLGTRSIRRWVFFGGVFPVLVGGRFALDGNTEVAAEGNIDYAFIAETGASARASASYAADTGWKLQPFDVRRAPPSLQPSLRKELSTALDARTRTGLKLTFSPEIYLVPLLDASFEVASKFQITASAPPDFLSTIRPIQLDKALAKVEGVARLQVTKGNIEVLRLTIKEVSLSQDVFSVPVFETPKFDLALDESGYPTLLLDGSARSGVLATAVPGSTTWHVRPEPPATSGPQTVKRSEPPQLSYVPNNPCSDTVKFAYSATDSVFGEFGRRFSNIATRRGQSASEVRFFASPQVSRATVPIWPSCAGSRGCVYVSTAADLSPTYREAGFALSADNGQPLLAWNTSSWFAGAFGGRWWIVTTGDNENRGRRYRLSRDHGCPFDAISVRTFHQHDLPGNYTYELIVTGERIGLPSVAFTYSREGERLAIRLNGQEEVVSFPESFRGLSGLNLEVRYQNGPVPFNGQAIFRDIVVK